MRDHPAEGIDEEEVLGGVGEAFVTVAHVQVDHAVGAVGPDDGEITAEDDVFQTHGEVLGGEAHEDFHRRVGARVGRPLIEFAGRSDEMLREVLRDRMRAGFHVHQAGLRGPGVAQEAHAAQKIPEPGPAGGQVVIPGCMEANPAASVLHILLEPDPFRRAARGHVRHDDDVIDRQILRQARIDIQDEPVPYCQLPEKVDGLV